MNHEIMNHESTLQTHPCNENRVFPVQYFSQGKTCFQYRDGFAVFSSKTKQTQNLSFWTNIVESLQKLQEFRETNSLIKFCSSKLVEIVSKGTLMIIKTKYRDKIKCAIRRTSVSGSLRKQLQIIHILGKQELQSANKQMRNKLINQILQFLIG